MERFRGKPRNGYSIIIILTVVEKQMLELYHFKITVIFYTYLRTLNIKEH